MVFMVTRFGGNALIYGVLGSVYPFFQLFGGPVLGKWSDIYGRKKILLLSQGGTVLGWLIFMASFFLPIKTIFNFSSSITGNIVITIPLLILFLARAIDGITGGNISVANAYLADITNEKERSKNFGKLTVSSNLGFILGPAIAGLLGATPYKEMLPVITTLVISFLALLVIFFFLPDSRALKFTEDKDKTQVKKLLGAESKECYKQKGEDKITLRKVLKIPGVMFMIILNFLIFLGFNFLYTSFPVHSSQTLKWTITEIGVFYSVLSLIMVLVEGPLLSIVSKKISEAPLVIFGNLVLAINFILLMSPNNVLIYSAAGLFALGNGLMWPSFLSLLSRIAGEKYQGSVQGFASSAGSLASIIGLITGGILYASTGTVTFLVAAVIMFVICLLSIRLVKGKRI